MFEMYSSSSICNAVMVFKSFQFLINCFINTETICVFNKGFFWQQPHKKLWSMQGFLSTCIFSMVVIRMLYPGIASTSLLLVSSRNECHHGMIELQSDSQLWSFDPVSSLQTGSLRCLLRCGQLLTLLTRYSRYYQSDSGILL